MLGQEPDHELMGLYAEALRDLGRFLDARRALDVVAEAGGSAERLASMLAAGMPFFDDVGFWKRAQITPNDLALAGVAEFADLDRLTIFADNLVPHVLRVDGVLRYDPGAGRPHRRGRAAAARRRGARDPRLRGARLRAAVGAARDAGAPARHRALEQRSGARGTRRAAAPHADGLLLTEHERAASRRSVSLGLVDDLVVR